MVLKQQFHLCSTKMENDGIEKMLKNRTWPTTFYDAHVNMLQVKLVIDEKMNFLPHLVLEIAFRDKPNFLPVLVERW